MDIVNNLERQRFEIEVEGEFAFLEYRIHEGTMYLMHTFVPDSLRGRGLAQKLAKFALDTIRAEKLPLKIYCPFVTKYIQEHPQYNDLLPT
ncbi:MAG: GNAT family N-acetyltransferase [Spirosomataceae bacterium]